jgi:hypothetical protein
MLRRRVDAALGTPSGRFGMGILIVNILVSLANWTWPGWRTVLLENLLFVFDAVVLLFALVEVVLLGVERIMKQVRRLRGR